MGILGSSSWEPDIGADVVAQKGGSSLEDLAVRHDRGEALNVMCDGVAKVINEIYSERSFHGIVSMGGKWWDCHRYRGNAGFAGYRAKAYGLYPCFW